MGHSRGIMEEQTAGRSMTSAPGSVGSHPAGNQAGQDSGSQPGRVVSGAIKIATMDVHGRVGDKIDQRNVPVEAPALGDGADDDVALTIEGGVIGDLVENADAKLYFFDSPTTDGKLVYDQ